MEAFKAPLLELYIPSLRDIQKSTLSDLAVAISPFCFNSRYPLDQNENAGRDIPMMRECRQGRELCNDLTNDCPPAVKTEECGRHMN
ncbi:hypothetical protein EJB05_57354, partial [Eragrostis curvula]